MSNPQYPSAKEAKQIAFEAKETIFRKEQKVLTDEIFEQIIDAAKCGGTSHTLTDTDAEAFDRLDVAAIFRERGYSVQKMQRTRDSNSTISIFFVISWA